MSARAQEWKGLPILSDLAGPELEAVEEEIEEQTLEGGVPLFAEGEEGGCLWILLDGRVRVASRHLSSCAELGAGTALGALSLMGGPRHASVETSSRCRLLRLSREGFRRIAASDPVAAERLVASIAREAARRAEAALLARQRSGVDPPSPDD